MRARALIVAIALMALPVLAGCGAGSIASPAESATTSPTLEWIQSDEFEICRDLYTSVSGASENPQRTCQAMAGENDVADLIADFGDPRTVEIFRADLTAQAAATATPTPAPPPPVAPAAPVPHVISDQARFVLDTNLGAGFDAAPAIKDQYCTMSDATLARTADIMVGMYRDITEADVVAYVNEVCGR